MKIKLTPLSLIQLVSDTFGDPSYGHMDEADKSGSVHWGPSDAEAVTLSFEPEYRLYTLQTRYGTDHQKFEFKTLRGLAGSYSKFCERRIGRLKMQIQELVGEVSSMQNSMHELK